MAEPASFEDAEPVPEVLLPFDQWMELSFRLLNRGREERHAILDEHGVEERDWMYSEQQHALALAQEVADGRKERAESYARRCAEELARRAAGAETAATEAVSAPKLSSDAEPAIETRHGAPLVAPPSDVPTFLHARAPAIPAPGHVAADLAATVDPFPLPSAMKSGALPFKSALTPSPMATPSGPSQAAAAPAGGETILLGAAFPVAATLPFGAAGAEPPPPARTYPRMSLKTYAAFYAEMAAFPNECAAVWQRYGIRRGEEKVALDQDWRARFDARPALRGEWEQLVAQQRERLARRPPA